MTLILNGMVNKVLLIYVIDVGIFSVNYFYEHYYDHAFKIIK
jgi:hypothetical protein